MLLGYAKISSKTSGVGSGVQSTKQNTIFQHYYQSCCKFLFKMNHMDEEQAVFEELTVSDFKKCSSTALKVHSQV